MSTGAAPQNATLAVLSSASWHTYLDQVEASAHEARAAVLSDGIPTMPSIDQPDHPPGLDVQGRVIAVAQLVEDVTALMVTHQEAVRLRLAALSRQSSTHRGYRGQTVGEQLDLLG
jgi:hypothetical protein